MDLVDGMRRYYFQHIFKPGEGIDVMKFEGTWQRIEYCTALSRFMASGKQVVLSSYGDRADGVLYRVVVDIQLSIGGIYH